MRFFHFCAQKPRWRKRQPRQWTDASQSDRDEQEALLLLTALSSQNAIGWLRLVVADEKAATTPKEKIRSKEAMERLVEAVGDAERLVKRGHWLGIDEIKSPGRVLYERRRGGHRGVGRKITRSLGCALIFLVFFMGTQGFQGRERQLGAILGPSLAMIHDYLRAGGWRRAVAFMGISLLAAGLLWGWEKVCEKRDAPRQRKTKSIKTERIEHRSLPGILALWRRLERERALFLAKNPDCAMTNELAAAWSAATQEKQWREATTPWQNGKEPTKESVKDLLWIEDPDLWVENGSEDAERREKLKRMEEGGEFPMDVWESLQENSDTVSRATMARWCRDAANQRFRSALSLWGQGNLNPRARRPTGEMIRELRRARAWERSWMTCGAKKALGAVAGRGSSWSFGVAMSPIRAFASVFRAIQSQKIRRLGRQRDQMEKERESLERRDVWGMEKISRAKTLEKKIEKLKIKKDRVDYLRARASEKKELHSKKGYLLSEDCDKRTRFVVFRAVHNVLIASAVALVGAWLLSLAWVPVTSGSDGIASMAWRLVRWAAMGAASASWVMMSLFAYAAALFEWIEKEDAIPLSIWPSAFKEGVFFVVEQALSWWSKSITAPLPPENDHDENRSQEERAKRRDRVWEAFFLRLAAEEGRHAEAPSETMPVAAPPRTGKSAPAPLEIPRELAPSVAGREHAEQRPRRAAARRL